MQIKVIEKTFRLAGENNLVAQFTFITTGTVHICLPGTGLQMEAHRDQIRIQDCTIIYNEGLYHGQRRALWALSLHAEDIAEFRTVLSELTRSPPQHKMPERKHWAVA